MKYIVVKDIEGNKHLIHLRHLIGIEDDDDGFLKIITMTEGYTVNYTESFEDVLEMIRVVNNGQS